MLQIVTQFLPTWEKAAKQNGKFVVGLRPIVRRNNKSYSSGTSGHAVIVRDMDLISLFGGKLTIARSLANQVVFRAPFNGQSL